MSTHNPTARRPTTVEVVESYLLDHLEGAWSDAESVIETAAAPVSAPLVTEAPMLLIEHSAVAVAEIIPAPLELVLEPPVADPDLFGVICFLVGPFRFLCPIDAVLDAPPEIPCSVVVDAVDLVPAPYRSQAAASQQQGRDVVWLKGGRLEIRGCRLDPSLAIRRSDLRSRGPRAEAPWIGATLREPPAFFLDSDAMQLHFMRRLRVGD